MQLRWRKGLLPGFLWSASVDRTNGSRDELSILRTPDGIVGLCNGSAIATGDTSEQALANTGRAYERLRKPKPPKIEVDKELIDADFDEL